MPSCFVSWLGGLWRAGLSCPSEISFAVGVSTIWVVAYNQAFWGQVVSAMWHPDPRSVAFLASLAVLLTVIQSTVLLLAPTAQLMRAVASALFIVAAVAAYFIGAYNAILGPAMMRNVLQTDVAEVSGLVSGSMLLHIVLLGALPAALVWRVRWREASLGVRLRRRIVFLAAAWTLALAGMIGTSVNYAVLLREHKPIRYAVLPMAPVISATRVVARAWKETRPAAAMDQGGPVVSVAAAAHPRPLVVLLVVGESARAASFELGGYERSTNPRLRGIDDLLYFDQARSCDTSTAGSVPCMFSPLGHDRFDVDDAGNHANLLDALQKAGVDVEWCGQQLGLQGRLPARSHRRVWRAQDGGAVPGIVLLRRDHARGPAPAPCRHTARHGDRLSPDRKSRASVCRTLSAGLRGLRAELSLERAASLHGAEIATPTTTPSCTPTTCCRGRSRC